jgi:hypothetical protein
MRTLAPLPALLLLAVSASAAEPMPEGNCTGRGKPPAPGPTTPYNLNTHPIPRAVRPYWEIIGYRFDDNTGRVLDVNGAVISQAEIDDLNKPFDASYERIDHSLWLNYLLRDYRLDEGTGHLLDSNAVALTRFQVKTRDAEVRDYLGHTALENLLGKLRGLDPNAPVPPAVRKDMQDLAKAGTKLPVEITTLLARNNLTVAQLQRPAFKSYADWTAYYDGQRSATDLLLASIPAGAKSGIASRRKEIPTPHERALGTLLRTAFNREIAKTAPGRELLSHFRGVKVENGPAVMVLKLTQDANDPNAQGAIYDPSSDRMIINHWHIIRILNKRLSPEKMARIKNRIADAKQLSKLLAEDPALIPLVVDDNDVMYFHELTHAAQTRRNRVDDELGRGNLPTMNPLAKEHEAHREHCRYLLSKPSAAIDRSEWRDYCLSMAINPGAFKEEITKKYLSTYSGSTMLDDVRTLQNTRRDASLWIMTHSPSASVLGQAFKQLGIALGDAELWKYQADVDKREKEFLAGLPKLRREAGTDLINYYEKTGAAHKALQLALYLPPGDVKKAQLAELTNKTLDWLTRSKKQDQRNERLNSVSALAPLLKAENRQWPVHMVEVYERDVRSYAEEILDQALKAPPAAREDLLKRAQAWAAVLRKPGDLQERIARARTIS